MPILSYIEKTDIHRAYNALGETKSELAKRYIVSPRTIGRAIDDIDQTINSAKEEYDDIINFGNDVIEEDEEDEEDNTTYFFVASEDSIGISKIVDGALVSFIGADTSNPLFNEASDIIWSSGGSKESLTEAFKLLDKKTFIEDYSDGLINVYPEENRVTYNIGNFELDFNGKLVPRLIQALKEKDSNPDKFTGLIEFSSKLIDNPSNRAVNELYDFLDASCIDINVEGDVICFKKVRSDFTDIFSGRFDNSVGQSPSVPRNMVDEDHNKTCSYGLHVCSSSYLPYFGGGNTKTIKVSVDPADFVSIPYDYYSVNDEGEVKAKARVCGYHVIEEI